MRAMKSRSAESAVLVALLTLACVTSPVEAQIINTLRGFDRQSPGWSGEVEGAVAIADGNTDYLEYALSASVQNRTERNRWALLGQYTRRSAGDQLVAENRMTHLRHNYRLRDNLASVVFLQGQHDPFRRIETRLLAGAGLRVDLLRGGEWEGGVGATWMLEGDELTDDNRGMFTENRLSFFGSLYSTGSEEAKVDVVMFYQPRVDDFSDARAFVAASVEVDIIGGLYLLLRYNLTHDSEPPPGVLRTDQTLRSGIGLRLE
jgi:hypothetical protein